MAKTVHDDVLDAALDEIADNANKLYVCSSAPTSFAEASSTYALADQTLTEGDGNGDYTVADGDAGGRKLTVAQQAGVVVDSSGTATHVALCDSGNSKLLYVTACTSQAITAGNTLTVNAWDITLGDPT